MRLLRSWRVPLRIARREARRARGRSILVLVMIALPVLAISAADVAMHTQDVRGTESLDRRLGSASAFVQAQEGVGHVFQGADPESSQASDGAAGIPLTTSAFVSRTLGGAPLVEARTGDVRVAIHHGVAVTQGTEVDLHNPIVRGLFQLRHGRLPHGPGEVRRQRSPGGQGVLHRRPTRPREHLGDPTGDRRDRGVHDDPQLPRRRRRARQPGPAARRRRVVVRRRRTRLVVAGAHAEPARSERAVTRRDARPAQRLPDPGRGQLAPAGAGTPPPWRRSPWSW